MRRRLTKLFRAERLCRNLSIHDVAHLLGYTKIAKGIRRIKQFETDGIGNREFSPRLFSALDLDLASVEAEISAEMRRERETWLAGWLIGHESHPVADSFVVRCFPGFYSVSVLPSLVITPAQPVEHVRAFAKLHGLEVCLPLSLSLLIYFDHQGNISVIASRSW